ncbi:MAG: glycyl-radical enzyme activating protein [Candidatus Heimdallarchaeota archaeon]|nr:glycyl-radical enzyme activating protein [Candidatus Heimdallarchaeota archaeon]
MNEKGIVFDIKKYALHDGPGIRTTVFLKGCLLNCWWCHNPESHKLEPEEMNFSEDNNKNNSYLRRSSKVIGKSMTVNEVLKEVEKDVIFYDESGGGVTFSGGEALVQHEFLLELLKESKKRGIHTTLDTSGYGEQEIFEKISKYVHLFLYDVKLIDEQDHIKYTSGSNAKILRNLEMLSSKDKEIIVRIPLIPGISDTEENLILVSQYLFTLKQKHEIHLLPYKKMGEVKYERLNIENKMEKVLQLSDEKINQVKEFFESNGFTVKVGG